MQKVTEVEMGRIPDGATNADREGMCQESYEKAHADNPSNADESFKSILARLLDSGNKK